MKLVYFILSASLSFTACVSLNMPIAGNRFLLPEVQGEPGEGKAGASAFSATDVVLVRDLDDSPEEVDHPDLRGASQIGISGAVGLLERFDLHVDTALGLGGVVQLLGDTQQASDTGNVSLALHSHVLSRRSEETLDSSSRSYTVSAKSSSTLIDYGAVAGYRVDRNALVYFGVARTQINAAGNATRRARDTGAEVTYDIDSARGISNVVNVGTHLGEPDGFFTTLEVGYSITSWPKTDTYGRLTYGLSTGYAW